MNNDVKVANKEKEKEKEKIICTCTGTTQSKILQLIDKGRDTLDEIASATGASTGCGSCDATIIEIIKEKTHLGRSGLKSALCRCPSKIVKLI